MKLSDGVFTVWITSMLLGVYTWHWGTLLACINSCHGRMGSTPLSAHWRWCQVDSDLPEDFVKYLWCHMDEYGWFWTKTGVLCLRKCLPCSLYVVLDFCVFGLGLFSCFCAMPVWCHINQPINQSCVHRLLAVWWKSRRGRCKKLNYMD